MAKRPNTQALFADALKRPATAPLTTPTQKSTVTDMVAAPAAPALTTGMVQRLPIQKIVLDANQMRKLLPRELATQLHNGKLGLTELMVKWAKQTGTSLSATYEPKAAENKRSDPRLNEIRELAHSIREHDLIHPITVFAQGDNYLVHIGERRALAHVWLTACGEKAFELVKAMVVERGQRDATQKLMENLQRSDLSAYEQAIGLWMVRYELSERPLPDFNDPKVWKAHQEDTAFEELVPWIQVDHEMGKSDEWRKQRLRVLRLSPEAITIVIEKRLPERTIRDLMRLRDDPKGQLFVLNHIGDAETETADLTAAPDLWTSSRVRDEVNAWITLNRVQKKRPTPSGIDIRTARVVTRAIKKIHAALGDKALKQKDVPSLAKSLAEANPGLIKLAREIRPVVEALAA